MAYSTTSVTTALPSHSHTSSSLPYTSIGAIGTSGLTGPTGAVGPVYGGNYGGAGGGGAYLTGGGFGGGMGSGISISTGGTVSITGTVNVTAGGEYAFVPSTAQTITLCPNNLKVPEGDKFADARDLFTTDLRLDGESHNHFHYLVWIENHGETFNDYGTVLRSDDGIYATFGSAKSRDHFEEWLDNYQRTFFKERDVSKTALPGMVTTAITGTLILDQTPDPEEIVFRKMPDKISCATDVFETWAWIVENCHEPVIRLNNGWLFTGANDAVLFRMK